MDAVMNRSRVIAVAVTLAALWAVTSVTLHGGALDILNALRGGNMAAFGWAYSIATGIVSYVNSFWGFALAVALAAAIGMSWIAVTIRALLARFGFTLAVRWATFT